MMLGMDSIAYPIREEQTRQDSVNPDFVALRLGKAFHQV
jgi:hypothetical protein